MDFLSKVLDFVFIRIPIRFFKKNILIKTNLINDINLNKRVLLYYKTDPLFSKRLVKSEVHSNNYEILIMIETLNELGFYVDLVDRSASFEEIENLLKNQYDIYIGNAAGNSAKFHVEILKKINAKKKIFYAAGPEPKESNRLVLNRHMKFDMRTGIKSIPRRIVQGKNFFDRFRNIDAIFYIGNNFSKNTYLKHQLPCYRMYPAIHRKFERKKIIFKEKKMNNFLYFGGDGLICKGLDLVLEAFDGLQDVNLDICGPAGENDFWNYYERILNRNKNIKFHGFVKPNSNLFKFLMKKCAFNIFPGSAEGVATSVLLCMKHGVIPITTYETGLDFGENGIKISNLDINNLKKTIIKYKDLRIDDYKKRFVETINNSMLYTESQFKSNFKEAILKTID